MTNHTVIISFSGRKHGNCEQISEYIKDRSNDSVKIYCFSDFSIQPCGNCCYECFDKRKECPHLEDNEHNILDDICNSDLTYFIVPNYCGHPGANLFIFNERSVGYFHGESTRLQKYMSVPKRFITVSNSESETFVNAYLQHTNEAPEILWLSTSKFGKRSIAGDLLDSIEAKELLQQFIEK